MAICLVEGAKELILKQCYDYDSEGADGILGAFSPHSLCLVLPLSMNTKVYSHDSHKKIK